MAAAQVLTTRSKLGALGAGAAAGFILRAASDHLLPSAAQQQRLRAHGEETISTQQVAATIGPMAFAFAAAVGAGVGRRSDTAGLSTALLGAATMFASTGASAVINAGTDSSGTYLSSLGAMSTVAAAGFAIGAVERIPLLTSKHVGLAALGASIGIIAPTTVSSLTPLPDMLRRSFELRDS